MKLASFMWAVLPICSQSVPTSPSSDTFQVKRLNIEERDAPASITSGELEARGIHNEASLQAWTTNIGCPGSPGWTWAPVGYSVFGEPPSPCYEFWEGGQRKGMRSVKLNGPWGPTCRLRMFTQAGCAGAWSGQLPGTCWNMGSSPWLSLRVHCD